MALNNAAMRPGRIHHAPDALVAGRLAPSMEDVISMARPVLRHRMALSFSARARGESMDAIIDSVVAQVTRTEAAA